MTANQAEPTGVKYTTAERPTSQGRAVRDLLRQRNFMLLLVGQFLSQVGDQFTLIAAITLVTDLSTSPLALFIPAVSMALPQIVFSLVGGVVADRWNRRRVMIASDLLRAGLVLGVILAHRTGQLSILYLSAAAMALVGTFFYPARNATIPNIVPKGLLLAANGLIQGSYIIALTLGPTLAGIILDLAGLQPAILFDSSAFVFSALTIFLLRLPRQNGGSVDSEDRGSVWQEMKYGLAYIRSSRILRRVLYVTAATTLGLGAIIILGIPHLKNRLAAGGLAYGGAMSMLGIGSVLGGLMVTRLSRRLSTNLIVGGVLMAGGVAVFVFTFTTSYIVVLLSVMMLGVCIVIARGALDTITQTLPPDQVRGRVQSVVNLTVQAGIALAEGLSAVLGHFTSIQAVFVGAGAVMAAAGAAAAFSLREAAYLVSRRKHD